jgi:hypothetical protein
MNTEHLVIAHFRFLDDLNNAVRSSKSAGYEEIDVYSPMPHHDIEDTYWEGKPRSPVRMFTLLGGLSGCLGAFLMTSWMSTDYPIRTSAKTLISVPAFVVIAFECTILLGAIFTLLSMFHFSRIPNIKYNPGYRGEFSNGTFGLTVRTSKDKAEILAKELEGMGAAKVEVQYVR